MILLAPPWALVAQAIDGTGDAHLRDGVHLRVVPGPALGLPVAPFRITRQNLGPGATERGQLRTDVIFRDQRGAQLQPPFQIGLGDVVTATFPDQASHPAVWARAKLSPDTVTIGGTGGGRTGPRGRLPRGRSRGRTAAGPVASVRESIGRLRGRGALRPGGTVVAAPAPAGRGLSIDPDSVRQPGTVRDLGGVVRPGTVVLAPGTVVRPGTVFEPGDLRLPDGGVVLDPGDVRVPGGGTVFDPGDVLVPDGGRTLTFAMRLEGLVYDEHGDEQVVAARSGDPWDVAASQLHALRITGKGTVHGVEWISAREVLRDVKTQLWREMGLPIRSAQRYRGAADASAQAQARVRRGAPARMGRHDQPAAEALSDLDPATENNELARVLMTFGATLPPLQTMLDGPLPPEQAVQEYAGIETGGATDEVASVAAMSVVMAAMIDPGQARWLGFADRDEAPGGDPGDVIAYVIDGVFAVDPAAVGPAAALLQRHLIESDARATLGAWDLPPVSVDGRQHVPVRCVACVTVGAPFDRPPAPTATAVLRPFFATPPGVPADQAEREVELALSARNPTGMMMLARVDGGAVDGLNDRLPQAAPWPPHIPPGGRALALTAERDPAVRQTGQGLLRDRSAPNRPLDYRLAQTDWFGRWSDVATVHADPLPPPPPPAPQLMTEVVPPAVPQPVPDGPLAGSIRVWVPVPPADSLAPGSEALAHLVLDGDHGVHQEVPVNGAQDTLEFTIPGLALPRCGAGQVVLQARWRTVRTTLGPATEKTVALVDPRPPEPVVLPITLAYTQRPDAHGLALLPIDVGVGGAGLRYRVYAADETRLVAMAADAAGSDAGLAAFVAAHSAAGRDLLARAQACRDHGHRFPPTWFRLVSAGPLAAVGGRLRFAHRVSGALRTLTLVKVVAESLQGVAADFGASGVAPFAVPAIGAPPPPLLEVPPAAAPVLPAAADGSPGPAGPAGAWRLRVRAVRGAVAPVRWRLRRSRISALDPDQMPIVATGSVPELPAEGPAEFDIFDTGALPGVPGAGLRPWTRYAWRVEVQAGPAPGTGARHPVTGDRLPETPELLPGAWSPPSGPAAALVMPPGPPPVPVPVAVQPQPLGVRLSWRCALPGGGSMGVYRFAVLRQLPGQPAEQVALLDAEGAGPEGVIDATGLAFWRSPGQPPSGTRWRVVAVDPAGRRSAPSAPLVLP